MKTIQEILDTVEPKILARGKQYYENGKIHSLQKDNAGGWQATVAGSGGTYSVAVQQDINGNITDFSCDCPYAYGDICKHIVAVLLAVQNGGKCIEKDAAEAPEARVQTADWIAAVPEDKLRQFVTGYAQEHEEFEVKLKFAVGFPDEKQELSAVKERIKIAMRAGTHRGYIDWRGCDNICIELDNILQYAQKRLEQDNVSSAYQIVDTVLQKGMYLASYADSSSGSVTEVLNYAEELLEAVCDRIAEKADAKLQNQFFGKLLRLAKKKCFDGWAENVYNILRIAAKLADEKNAEKFMSFLDTMDAQNKSDYYKSSSKLVKVELTKKLKGYAAARKLLYEDLSDDALRLKAYDWAMAERDWAEAIRLCREKLSQQEDAFYQTKWLELLAGACQNGNDRSLLEETMKELILCGETQYYDKYKYLLQTDGTWEQVYADFRDVWYAKLAPDQSLPLLQEENETERMMDAVEKDPSCIESYGKFLAEIYPQRVYRLFKKLIDAEEESAQNRKGYSRICMLIKELHEAGGTILALETLNNLEQKYPRRPAMQEEIQQTRGRIMRAAEKP